MDFNGNPGPYLGRVTDYLVNDLFLIKTPLKPLIMATKFNYLITKSNDNPNQKLGFLYRDNGQPLDFIYNRIAEVYGSTYNEIETRCKLFIHSLKFYQ